MVDLRQARFVFPELMAESAVSTRYENISETTAVDDDDYDDGTWQAMLYNNNADERTRTGTRSKTTKIPSYLIERRYRFTQLTLQQLLHCLVLGTLNWLGVMMMHQSLAPGGLLQLPAHDPNQVWTSAAATLIRGGLLPVLHFYARLFFVVPCGRLALVLALNRRRTVRNQRRARLALGPRLTLGKSGAQVHGTECLAI